MDGIFFSKDPLTGKRRPLPFFYDMLMVIGFLLVLALVGLYIVRDKQSFLTPSTPSPVSLATNTPAPTATDTPTTPTATWTPAPTEDPIAAKRQALLQAINACEKDPSKWEMVRRENTKFHYILKAPRCVLEDLGRTLPGTCWSLAVAGPPRKPWKLLAFRSGPLLFLAKPKGLKHPWYPSALPMKGGMAPRYVH